MSVLSRSRTLLIAAVTAAIVAAGASHPARAQISATAFGSSAACQSLRSKYPTLVGKALVVGLGGYTAGFEAPSADDPSKIVGLDPDLFDYMGACLGFTHSFQNGSFNVLITSITSGRVDIGPNLYVTPPRLKKVAFVSSFAVIDGSVVAKGNPKKLTSIQSLCGATVAAAAGTYEAVSLIPPASDACVKAGKPKINILLLQATDNSVLAVQSGRADIYLTAESDADALAKGTPGLATAFAIDLPILNGFPIAKPNTVLQKAVLDAMTAVQAAGIEKILLQKWGQGADSQTPATLHDE
jgi:polar amino acid transport system substrate-binding protein